MATMLALHQNKYGDAVTEMILGQLPKPTPASSQVLIKVHAAALNPVDIVRNVMKLEDNFPIVVGYDVAGVVEEVGSDVTDFKVGDRVFGNVMPDGLGPKVSGSIAEYAVSEAYLLAPIPANIGFADAAAAPLVCETSIGVLRLAGCKSGDKVFVSGGAGGVGIHLIQIAKKLFGASEVATTASGAKIDFVKQYGADHVVDYRAEDAGEILRGWADVVVDCTKETDMGQKILKGGGKLVTIADFSKPEVTSYMLEGSKDMITKVASMLADGRLVAVIDTVYSMEEAQKAVQHQAGGRARGKVVIKLVD